MIYNLNFDLIKDQQTKELVEEFLNYKKLSGRENSTVIKYGKYIIKLFYQTGKTLEDINSIDIFEWLQRNWANSKQKTIIEKISILSCFFNYCLSQQYIDKSPIKRWWRPRIPQPIPKSLNKSETARIIITSEKLSLRDRTIIELFRSSGVRRSELINLTINQINLEKRNAKILGKGRKERIVNFSEECFVLLSELIQDRINTEEPVFINKEGEKLSGGRVYKIVSKVGKMAGLHNMGPHRFRHTYATKLATNGADLASIGDSMGHSQISTTKIYTTIPNKEKNLLYQKYMG